MSLPTAEGLDHDHLYSLFQPKPFCASLIPWLHTLALSALDHGQAQQLLLAQTARHQLHGKSREKMEAFNEPLSAQISLPAATKWLCENKSTEVTAQPGSCVHPPGYFQFGFVGAVLQLTKLSPLQKCETLPGVTTAGGQCQWHPSKNTEGSAGLWGATGLRHLSPVLLPGSWASSAQPTEDPGGSSTARDSREKQQKSKCFAPEWTGPVSVKLHTSTFTFWEMKAETLQLCLGFWIILIT